MALSCQDWMSDLPEELWDTPLTDLAIPGSHDAMSYCLDINSPLVPSESDFFRLLDGLFYCFTRPTIFKWATTQDKTIDEQLSMGIRYFDLRVAHKPSDSSNDLYFTHVIYTHLTVLETLVSVAAWLESHPKEIKLFGSKLCPTEGSSPDLAESLGVWLPGRPVLRLPDCSETSGAVACIPYWWANQRTAQGVINYLDWNKDIGRPEGFFVSGLNLTADRFYITENRKQSLRTLTYSNWECLRTWLEEQKPGSDPKSLNIIAGDFVGPLPLCSLVIALNQKLLRKNAR
ncbi:PI-PLC X domain-containing protein 1 [Larimichthys crocea]|uniref:PI-PLC X domain-containing protein 1 n=1 Tax=Larimichthys crocea TaxID=215358 RepID=A0A6G0ISZ1_LARCR|nr:PI-PLC X domain-containing protein 1 [Larimichthys crocea]